MELDWLNDFLALAKLKTFSRAADARNVTQPAFSRRIRALEDWIGAPLFVRGAHGATLTEAGLNFRPSAEELAAGLERLRRATRAIGDQEKMTLSVAATHALSFTFFPSWIRELMQVQALGAINLISDSMEGCEAVLLSGEVHFLLCHFHPDAQTRFEANRFPSVAVGHDLLTPFCAPAGDGRPKWPLPGTSANPIPYLSYSKPSGLGRILTVCRDRPDVHMTTAFTSHLAATLMTLARDGHGVSWLPATLAAEDVARGRLVRAGSEQFDIAIQIRLFRSLECRNRAADELWDRLIARDD